MNSDRSAQRSRNFYIGMAALFFACAVVGFAPNSIAILSGAKPNPPLMIHIHAALMTAWLTLLLAQAALANRGRMDLHMTLGFASLLLAPLVLLLILIIAVPTFFNTELPLGAKITQGKRILFFAGCIGAAILLRQSAPEAHKRLMFIGTFAVLDAAFFRMTFLPDWGLDHPVIIGHANMTILLVLFLFHDLWNTGRVHWAYWLTIPPILVLHLVAAMSL